jgi:hypothetical protein
MVAISYSWTNNQAGIAPSPIPIRRVVYIRPCCHHGLYRGDHRRCQLNSDHRSLGVTDQLFLVEKLQRAIPFRVNGISKAAVNCWEHGHDRAALMIVGCIINLFADGKFRHRELPAENQQCLMLEPFRSAWVNSEAVLNRSPCRNQAFWLTGAIGRPVQGHFLEKSSLCSRRRPLLSALRTLVANFGMSQMCRYCCKSHFAQGVKISEGRWCVFRVEI